jgi:molybdenum cofactor cytidylyltransferase
MVPMMETQLSSLQIVVLAAGFSKRLGRSKSLATIRGTSLIRRTVTTLSKVTHQTILVITAPRPSRAQAELRGLRVSILANPRRAAGMSTSVALALRKGRWSSGTLFLPVDFADLNALDLKRLISRWRGSKRKVTARRTSNGAATPLILPKFLYRKAARQTGDIGLRDFVAGLRGEQRTLLNLSSAERDVDTTHDLAMARRRPDRDRMNPRTRKPSQRHL